MIVSSLFRTLVFGISVSAASGMPLVLAGQTEGPPPNDQQITGPPVEGVITSTISYNTGTQEYEATSVVVASCKSANSPTTKLPVILGPAVSVVSATTFNGQNETTIMNRRLGTPPATCFPDGGTLIITGVSKFNNTGVQSGPDGIAGTFDDKGGLGAEVSISVLVPKK